MATRATSCRLPSLCLVLRRAEIQCFSRCLEKMLSVSGEASRPKEAGERATVVPEMLPRAHLVLGVAYSDRLTTDGDFASSLIASTERASSWSRVSSILWRPVFGWREFGRRNFRFAW